MVDFHYTKVRVAVTCGYCAAVCVICSNIKVHNKDGPSVKDLEALEGPLERDRYACGSDIKGGKLYSNGQASLCGHIIESEYNPPRLEPRVVGL